MKNPDQNESFHILVVDDAPANTQLLSSILRKNRYRVSVAWSGQDALKKVREQSFDLILLDIIMPEMDGFETCEMLKSDPKTQDIPVIFITAKADMESIIKGFELGAVDYISKPFHGMELLARLSTHLQLQNARRLLEEANRSKDRFFSILAHDLRSPLHTILGASRNLARKYDQMEEKKRKEYIDGIHSSVQQMDKLLGNLLEWAKIQIEQVEFDWERLDLYRLVSEHLLLMKPIADSKNIALYNDVTPETVVFGDKNMIGVVIRNLISNSIKFSENNGIIRIRSQRVDDFQEISVTDSGVGLSKEEISKLFKIDTNFSKSGTKGEKGSGIGLVLCKEYVEKNGGRITVISDPGKGSRFVFTLPVAPPG